MSAAIGSISCTSFNGSIKSMQATGEVIRRAGVDGFGALRHAVTGVPVIVETKHLVASAAALLTLKENVSDLLYTFVSVTDGVGNNWSSVLVEDAQVTSEYAVLDNGVAKILAEIQWTLRADDGSVIADPEPLPD
jgi:hypothetical protein